MASFASKRLFAPLAAVAAFAASSLLPAEAGLVAKWDFDNFDSENPASAAILQPTVGTLAAIVATGTGSSTPVADGTLGEVEVMAPEATGLKAGDYALKIPMGTHLKFPLPSGIVRDKNWMVRVRFYSPSASDGKIRTLLQPNWNNNTAAYWAVNENNLIYGPYRFFMSSGKEEDEGSGKVSGQTRQSNYRRAAAETWHSFAAYFCENGTATTLNGYRAVCDNEAKDLRTTCTRSGVTVQGFNEDGFIIGGADVDAGDYEIWVASVEVWDDIPMFHRSSYIPTAASSCFTSCSVATLKDLYISGIFAGGWAGSAFTGVPAQAFERYIPQDGSFMCCNMTGAGILMDSTKTQQGTKCVLPQFTANGDDLNVHYWKGGSGGTYHRKIDGSTGNTLGTVIADKDRSTSLTGGAYSIFNLYALPLIPIADDLPWTYLMGYTSFGNPVLTICENGKTVTFDAAPQAESLTLDSSRGDGKASVTFAYASDELKSMSSLGDIKVRENVTLTLPAGVSIAGSLTLDSKAALVFDISGLTLANRDVVFTAAEGITIPAGTAINDIAAIPGGTLELSGDGTQIVFLEDSTIPFTATWTGLGDRADVLDPLNWQCRNVNGIVLDGAIPTEDTAITISGETSFNLPANQVSRLQYRSLELGTSFTLTADCDWRGFGTAIPYPPEPTIDLQGHKLYVCDWATAANVTDTTSGAPGEYHLEIASKQTLRALAMTGNVRFVKEGAGELVLNYAAPPSYRGGTEIRQGYVDSTQDATSKHQFGTGGGEIVVKSGGTLYPYNHENWLSVYKIVLDGGSMYTWWAGTANGVIFGSLELLSDSTMATASSGGRFTLWQNNAATLNGHNLYLSGPGEMIFGSGVRIYGGTISNDTGTARFNGTVYAANTTFDISGKLNMSGTLNASNYVARYTGSSNSGTGSLNVYGTFKPVGAGFYGPTMQDGSTVDLSEWKTGVSATSRFPLVSGSASGRKTMSFASGTVTFDLSGMDAADIKALAKNNTYLTKWDSPPAADFRLDAATAARGCELKVAADGLMLVPLPGFIIHIAGNKEVAVPREWVAAKCGTTAVDDYVDGATDAVETWLGGTGANGLPRWQSWLLGLEPADAKSVVLCRAVETQPGDGTFAVGANIDVQAGSGAAVTAYLDTSADGKTWAEKVEEQALTSGGTVSFSRTLASGERGFYRIRLAVQ